MIRYEYMCLLKARGSATEKAVAPYLLSHCNQQYTGEGMYPVVVPLFHSWLHVVVQNAHRLTV